MNPNLPGTGPTVGGYQPVSRLRAILVAAQTAERCASTPPARYVLNSYTYLRAGIYQGSLVPWLETAVAPQF